MGWKLGHKISLFDEVESLPEPFRKKSEHEENKGISIAWHMQAVNIQPHPADAPKRLFRGFFRQEGGLANGEAIEYCTRIKRWCRVKAEKAKRGGARAGAGRKPGTGLYGEPTVAVRVPASRLLLVKGWLERVAREGSDGRVRPVAPRPVALALPFYGSRVAAGFPSPADDHLEGPIDLNEHLVAHPAATFVVKVEGESRVGAGIRNGDLLVVDRSREAKSGSIVVAVVGGELTVKRLRIEKGRVWLAPENPAFRPIEVGEGAELVIWGVVAHAIRSY